MIKSSPWTKWLPMLALASTAALVAAAVLLMRESGQGPSVDRLMTLTQAARADARAAVAGDAGAADRVAAALGNIERLVDEGRRESGGAAAAFFADAAWNDVRAGLSEIVGARDELAAARADREKVASLVPQLLASTGNLIAALGPAEIAANERHVARFELALEGIRQDLRALDAGDTVDAALGRLDDAERFLGQMIRGLRGEDTSLGIRPAGASAASELAAAGALFDDTRSALAALLASGGWLTAADAARVRFDRAAAGLLGRWQALPAASGRSVWADRVPYVLVGAAVLLLITMLVANQRARDFRRLAEVQTEQNKRNQEAILRLLDELSSLADGDLTVQATVTEDITGAIADSINYAIEALRDLVTTIDETSILVDAAAKQSEAMVRHLVRSSEMQAKQAEAVSEAVAQMAQSIEEVSGNAERCSDVARHAVDVAHKGGEAVRRTIDGMNTIRETIQDTSKRIKRLGESSQEIGNIVELIEEIAEQTNILALNASIEASRAGESSRGFAVVADEVQKLAERSAAATRKIEVLVRTIQSDTNEAVVSMERSTTDVVGGALLAENAGAALDEIEQVSHQIASLVHNISISSREQTNATAAITESMRVLRDISAKTKESTNAASAAISKLSELASQLRQTVNGFTLPDNVSTSGVLSASRVSPVLAQPSAATGEAPAEGRTNEPEARIDRRTEPKRRSG
ncbi:MAG: methyl-accepting chemotaxis protein [Gammaproteobacteria bacterium]